MKVKFYSLALFIIILISPLAGSATTCTTNASFGLSISNTPDLLFPSHPWLYDFTVKNTSTGVDCTGYDIFAIYVYYPAAYAEASHFRHVLLPSDWVGDGLNEWVPDIDPFSGKGFSMAIALDNPNPPFNVLNPITQGSTLGEFKFRLDNELTDGVFNYEAYFIDASIGSVPEPATIILIGFGFVFLSIYSYVKLAKKHN